MEKVVEKKKFKHNKQCSKIFKYANLIIIDMYYIKNCSTLDNDSKHRAVKIYDKSLYFFLNLKLLLKEPRQKLSVRLKRYHLFLLNNCFFIYNNIVLRSLL